MKKYREVLSEMIEFVIRLGLKDNTLKSGDILAGSMAFSIHWGTVIGIPASKIKQLFIELLDLFMENNPDLDDYKDKGMLN